MFNIYSVTDSITNGYNDQSIFLVSLIAIICAISVIISKNPIISVLFLIGLFLSISVYLMLLGLNFVGLSYLLVYVGAVTILFLFILMLINVRISELSSDTSNSIPLAIIIVIAFTLPLDSILPLTASTYSIGSKTILNDMIYSTLSGNLNKISNIFDNDAIYLVLSQSWDSNLAEHNHISSIGNLMYTSHSIWLIITSVILLLAMVGAIVITIKK